MFFKSRIKKIIVLSIFAFFSVASLFAETKNVSFITGYDKSQRTLNALGISSNTTNAVTESLESLSSLLESEIELRCASIYKNFADSNTKSIDFFLRGISANMPTILRSMLKKAKCTASYSTDREEVVVYYSLDCNDFESMFSSYIDKFNDEDDQLQTYTKEIKNINKFFKFKYNNSQERIIRVQV